MPSYPCSHPTCTAYVAARGDYCPEHAHLAAAKRREYQAQYDQTRRDEDAKDFYNSRQWKAARAYKLAEHPTCELCGRFATMVHHRLPLRERPDLKLTFSNFMSLCDPCHAAMEQREKRGD
jgi:5-methylcytosine-specific restriction protein A